LLERGPVEFFPFELMDAGVVLFALEIGAGRQQLRAQSCLAFGQPAALGADLG
jgi:hypothetical protein